MLRMRMFPCTLLDPVAFLTALCGVVRQEALGSDLRRMKGRKSGRVEEWKGGRTGRAGMTSGSRFFVCAIFRVRFSDDEAVVPSAG
jgi:hypothetical protein